MVWATWGMKITDNIVNISAISSNCIKAKRFLSVLLNIFAFFQARPTANPVLAEVYARPLESFFVLPRDEACVIIKIRPDLSRC